MPRARAGRAGPCTHVAHGAPRKTHPTGAWIAALAAALLACGPGAGPGSAPPDRRPDRIVSLVPAASEILAALGAGDRVVGRALDDPTPAVAGVPPLGRVLAPSLEAVLSARPDLILVAPEAPEDARGALERALPGRVHPVRVRRLDDVAPAVRLLGRLVGLDTAAAAVAGALTTDLERVRAAVADAARPSVLWIVSVEPWVAAGPGTFLDDLVQVAGGRNVLADAVVPWPSPALEALAARAPEVVLWSAEVAPPARGLAWATRLHVLDPDVALRPGPAVGSLAHRLAALLHDPGDLVSPPSAPPAPEPEIRR